MDNRFKVFAEIDRLEKENCMNKGKHFCMRRATCLGRIRQLLTEPVSDDLDAVAREYAGIPADAPRDLSYCVQDKKAKYDAVIFGARLYQPEVEEKSKDFTISEDIEKELDNWRHIHFRGRRDGKLSGEYLERSSQLDLARHFAQWQMQQIFKLKDGVELFSEDESDNFDEEFAKILAERKDLLPKGETFTEYDLYKVALHFCGWKKRQMMKNAIDGDITFDYYGDDNKTYACVAHESFCLEERGLKDRDKVKVIIIKA